ncbi:hypothetical protein PCANC_26198 [Puccinia coronata f. sp. avenae]|uniref:Uncharacterized protein n=1 Tax=Puccinia coronata f. sp. avenae TaxID=200324 RepID=A0A2N5U6B1_9BASI|nr:hypothetical protein PCANC_26198 [Puccinia coronata f. sp. avenae]
MVRLIKDQEFTAGDLRLLLLEQSTLLSVQKECLSLWIASLITRPLKFTPHQPNSCNPQKQAECRPSQREFLPKRNSPTEI